MFDLTVTYFDSRISIKHRALSSLVKTVNGLLIFMGTSLRAIIVFL